MKNAITETAQGETVRYTAELRLSKGDVRKIDKSLIKDEFGHVVYIVPEGRDVS